ncbi:MAG: hypothetical protein AAFQ05_00860 [Pseudomonadota bacterium]
MAQTPQTIAEAGKSKPQPASTSSGKDDGPKTVSARVFTDFAAI